MLEVLLSLALAAQVADLTQPYDTGVEGSRVYAVSETVDGQRQVLTVQPAGEAPQLFERARHPDGSWSTPRLADFDGAIGAADGFFTPDGSRLLFMRQNSEPAGDWDIWSVTLDADGWGDASPLGRLNSPAHEIYPTVDQAGRIVFASDRADPGNGRAVWMAEPDGAEGYVVSQLTGGIEGHPSISNPLILPDGTAIIYYLREDGAPDLFYSCSIFDGWSGPRPLTGGVNTEGAEFAPGLSHDGRVLYFTRNDSVHAVPLADAVPTCNPEHP